MGGDPVAKGEYRQTLITQKSSSKIRDIKVERIHDNYTPSFENYFFVAILHDPSENKSDSRCLKQVTIEGQEIKLITGGNAAQRSNTLNASTDNAWYYNDEINASFIKVFDNKSLINITAASF